MAPNPWSPTPYSQYLSTVLNDPPAAHAASAAAAAAAPTTTTPPRARPTSTSSPAHHQQHQHNPHAPLTPAQRSAQARGKFPSPNDAAAAESYAERQRRHEAAAVLDSQEVLMWYAASRGESVAQTRRWFQNVVFGVPQERVEWCEEWDVKGLGAPGRGSPMGKGKGREREREREKGTRKRGSMGGE